MFISDSAIKKPVITVVAMLTLVVFGLISLKLLHTDEFPDVAVPLVVMSVPYPGASPDPVEREIVEPIEEPISGVNGVRKIRSNAPDSFGVLIVEFGFDRDMQAAMQEIRDEINGIRNDLPVEMKEPVLTRLSPTDFPILSLTLRSASMSVAQLTLLADPGITRKLRAIAGVGEVNIIGPNTREVTVDLHPDALMAANVSVGGVVGALQMQNLAVPVGRLLGSNDERTIRLGGRVENAADFHAIVVADRG